MPNYKLTYFDMKTLGEPIRFLLSYMGEEFEDNRINLEQWQELKDRKQKINHLNKITLTY